MKGLILSEEKRFFIVGSNNNNFVRVSKKSFKDKQYGEEIVYTESDLYVSPFKRLLLLNIFRNNILVYGVVTAILLLGLNILSYDTETKQFSLKEDPFGLMSAFDSGRNNSIAYKEKDSSAQSVNSNSKDKSKEKTLDKTLDKKTSDDDNLLNESKKGMVAINNSDNAGFEKKISMQISESKPSLSLISEPSVLKISSEETEFLQESTGLDGVNVDSKTVDIANFLRSSSSTNTGIAPTIIKVNNSKYDSDSNRSIKRTPDSLERKESESLVAVIDKPTKDFNKEITSGNGIEVKPSGKGNDLPVKEDTKKPGKETPKPPIQKPVVLEPTDNKLEEKPRNDDEEETNSGKEEGSKPYNPNVPIQTDDGMVAGSDYEKELEKNNHGNQGNNGNANGNQGNNGNANGNQGNNGNNGNANGNQGNNGNANGNQGNNGNNGNANGNQGNNGNNGNANGNQGNKDNNSNANGNQGNNGSPSDNKPTTPDKNTEEPTMPNTCSSDGYYYDKEMVLFFEPDENGEIQEVWKEIEVKKICN